jgi:folate-dependent phosphoribosylglycinamide formyltransferase PurN
MTELTPLYSPEYGVMRVAGLMSGTGTNLKKIIEHEKNYHVAVIFSDNIESNALKIGKEFDIPVIVRDKKGFYEKRKKPLRDMEVRMEFDSENIKALSKYDCPVAAYAGYMSIASSVLVNAFLGVNVHPADLSILDENGKRKYTGDNAVFNALVSGERELRSSTHLITNELDGGPILMVSCPIDIDCDQRHYSGLREIANDYQDLLKRKGDWVIFPRTLEDLACGRFSRDKKGNLYYGTTPIPFGMKLE